MIVMPSLYIEMQESSVYLSRSHPSHTALRHLKQTVLGPPTAQGVVAALKLNTYALNDCQPVMLSTLLYMTVADAASQTGKR